MGRLIEQFMRFGLVGVINTLLDFALFNLLAGKLRWRKIPANLVSTSVAISFSFLANWHWVFPTHGGQPMERGFRFLAITLASGWVVQNMAIRLLDSPTKRVLAGFVEPRLPKLDIDFVHRNTLKAAAVGAAMFWNFCWYRAWVFQ